MADAAAAAQLRPRGGRSRLSPPQRRCKELHRLEGRAYVHLPHSSGHAVQQRPAGHGGELQARAHAHSQSGRGLADRFVPDRPVLGVNIVGAIAYNTTGKGSVGGIRTTGKYTLIIKLDQGERSASDPDRDDRRRVPTPLSCPMKPITSPKQRGPSAGACYVSSYTPDRSISVRIGTSSTSRSGLCPIRHNLNGYRLHDRRPAGPGSAAREEGSARLAG